MAKVSIQTIENLQNESSAIGKINANFAAVQAIIETLLSRDGLSPNHMQQLLDMNNQRIINLPAPIHYHEPARHGELQQYVDEATTQAERAELEADEAATSAALALQSELQALAYLTNFLQRYLGALPSDPLADLNGEELIEGAIYFNTEMNVWRHYVYLTVYVDTDIVYVDSEVVEVRVWRSIPVTTLRSMPDTNTEGMVDGDFLEWNAGLEKFVNRSVYVASEIPFVNDATDLEAEDVQEALVEINDRVLPYVYDMAFFAQGLLNNNELIFAIPASRQFILPADTTGFYAIAATTATSNCTIEIRKDGIQCGTIFFAAGQRNGIITIPGNTLFQPGDVLTLNSPPVPDTTLRDIAISFLARRP